MARFDVRHLDPTTGKERLGTFHNWYMDYASLRNVIRFGLAKPGLPVGQYHIYPCDHKGKAIEFRRTVAYKRV